MKEELCFSVLRSISYLLGYNNVNELLIKATMKLTDNITPNGWSEMENIIGKSLGSNNNNVNNEKTIKGKTKNEKNSELNEQCCKLFYQIINNSSHLKQSNNFKTLKLTPKPLNQMLEKEYSCSEYLFAHAWQLTDYKFPCGGGKTGEFFEQWGTKLKQVQESAVINHNECMDNIFKSIKSLYCDGIGTLLFHLLPIDTLFNENESQLENIKIDQAVKLAKDMDWRAKMLFFEQEYLDLKNIDKKRRKIKVSNCISYGHDEAGDNDGCRSRSSRSRRQCRQQSRFPQLVEIADSFRCIEQFICVYIIH